MRMMTVSSGFTTTQALISSGVASEAASATLKGMRKPKVKAAAVAAAPATNPRRETLREFVMIRSLSLGAGGEMDAFADADICATAADVCDFRIDLFVRRFRCLGEKR